MLEETDTLGLDKPIKLGRPLRIPKLTDEVLLENNRGLPQITQNYRKLLKAFKVNDRRYTEKSKSLSKSAAQQLKVATETENLKKVLLFYQLWCHGLFPRANFEDCLRILRNHKSSVVRNYRRSLLDAEIRRLKIKKGIIVENGDSDSGLDPQIQLLASSDTATGGQDNTEYNQGAGDSDEDDWGFLSVNRRSTNGLFIGDEDDAEENEPSATTGRAQLDDEDVDFDDFDENDFPLAAGHNDLPEDEHQAELDIMNEMGL